MLTVAVITAVPVVLYQDAFGLGADLALDARVLLLLPAIFGTAALVLVVVTAIAWKQMAVSGIERAHHAAVALAAVVMAILICGWNIVPFGF